MFSNVGGTVDLQTVTSGIEKTQIGGLIKTQVCVSGVSRCKQYCIIKKRYIPPNSTCVFEDDPTVVVIETIEGNPPAKAGTLVPIIGRKIGKKRGKAKSRVRFDLV
jgi:hypothetical protein